MEQFAINFTVISKTQTTNDDGSIKRVTILECRDDASTGMVAITTEDAEVDELFESSKTYSAPLVLVADEAS